MANANIALSKEILQNLTKLSELTKQPAQELAEKLLGEAIELEMDDFLLSVVADQYDIESAETVDYEDVKWRC
ncbi:hypothetical protein NMD99_01875 [Wolbachia endosymbiont of Listronotus oregonensis]|uniref:hypothetical protein n=1 Tax=unclassified Wolbachia TaxID=2640676 RepID=UPI00209F4DA8|nr:MULTISPECIES: hypothetical protein [Rickettsiales]MBV2145293.1 hypothetical protein [Wolbachia endosymbiont of Pissodes strobi]WMT84771.1 hypothetical protein NMD99_01875 [Wolbachia endosymbiont of Listronotus oregonensis]